MVASIPSSVHSDRAPRLIAGNFGKILAKYHVQKTTTETNTPQQNRAEKESVKPTKKLGA